MDEGDKFFEYVELYAKEVLGCSSQYGSDGRTAYVAENLAGPPAVYPNFGDSTHTCAFMNYGTRWETEPASLMPPVAGGSEYGSTDYVDVYFDQALIVVGVQLFETYFPGAIVAIRACYRDQPTHRPVNVRGLYWVTLWKDSSTNLVKLTSTAKAVTCNDALLPAYLNENVTQNVGKARIFEPVLSNIPLVLTDVIRIEFDVRRSAYHTEIDAIRVRGYAPLSKDFFYRMNSRVARRTTSRQRTVSCNELESSSPYSDWPAVKCLPIIFQHNNELDGDADNEDSLCCTDLSLALQIRPETAMRAAHESALCPLSRTLYASPFQLLPALTNSCLMVPTNQTTLATYRNEFAYLSSPLLCFPDELILQIFSYLDLQNLCLVSSVCRLFYYLADDTLSRMTSINLQPYWATLSDVHLLHLGKRLARAMQSRRLSTLGLHGGTQGTSVQYHAWHMFSSGISKQATLITGSPTNQTAVSHRLQASTASTMSDKEASSEQIEENELSSCLRRLDLSWCGNYKCLTPVGFGRFLSLTCQHLTTLRLSSCQLINDDVLLNIINTCGGLEELDLSSCRSITADGFVPLGRLIHLRWLSLYRTKVDDRGLDNLSSLCQHLLHVNLAACNAILDADSVVSQLVHNNPFIESLNIWRLWSFTADGLAEVANCCPNLLQLNLGWCSGLESQPPNCIANLVSKCRRLRVLILTAIRSIRPEDVEVIGECLLGSLESLDLVGNILVSKASIETLLRHTAHHLQFLDLSHCLKISLFDVVSLRAAYPCTTILAHHHQNTVLLQPPPTAQNTRPISNQLPTIPFRQMLPPAPLRNTRTPSPPPDEL